jgi:hypothetical protein
LRTLLARALWGGLLLLLLVGVVLTPLPARGAAGRGWALASPGLCLGPVCGEEITRSAKYHWQLRLKLNDHQGHRERVVVDCRSGLLSPRVGPVERDYAVALARRACRLAGAA